MTSRQRPGRIRRTRKASDEVPADVGAHGSFGRSMILIIAEPTDWPALWLRARLAARVAVRVAIVTPTQLVCSSQIVHRISSQGTSSRFLQANGQAIESAGLSG